MTTRTSIFVLLLALSFALCCRERKDTVSPRSSQPNAHQQPPELNDALSRILGSPTISPQQLEAYTNQRDGYETDFVDFKPIWRRLEISAGQDGLFDGFDPSSTTWAAELIDVSSQLKPVKIVVKLSANGGADRRYLVFVKDEAESNVERWSFSGHIDITDNYEASEATMYHRVVSDSNHVWLVLRSAPRIGTGVSASEERWRLVDTRPPREVLKYPLKGGRVMGELSDLEYEASVPESQFVADRLTQTVRYKVSFGVANNPKFHWLFAKRAQVNFVWDENDDQFAVDGPTSNVSAEEVMSTFAEADEARFIKYNLSAFVRLAIGAGTEQRQWLKRVQSIESLMDHRRQL